MNELQIFRYGDTPLRTVERDGEIWWVLKDVCGVLGIHNHSNRPPAKLSKAVKVADASDQGKSKSKANSAVAVTFR